MWDWIPDPATQLRALGPRAERWQPDPGLGLDGARLRALLVDAAAGAAPWLRHPCVSRLTHEQPATPARDLALALWVAAHTDRDPGRVVLNAPITVWSAAGDPTLPAGCHDLRTLAPLVAAPAPVGIGLDLWCTSTGLRSAGAYSLDDDHDPDGLARDIGAFVRTVHALETRLPAVATWLRAATKVVRPLVPVAGCARSTHYPDVLGLIEADLSRGPAQTIELIVHETAHLHLRAAQADDPLVDPADDGTYPSPLRPEPRPLIGILLAYHALAYIAAALLVAVDAGLLHERIVEYVRVDVAPKRDDAGAVLDGAVDHLTDEGRRFLHLTHEVSHVHV